jgi:hypothetical protein
MKTINRPLDKTDNNINDFMFLLFRIKEDKIHYNSENSFINRLFYEYLQNLV